MKLFTFEWTLFARERRNSMYLCCIATRTGCRSLTQQAYNKGDASKGKVIVRLGAPFMQRKRTIIWILLFALPFAVLSSGCRPAPTPNGIPASQQQVELCLACPTEATAAVLRGHGQPWALRQGVKLALSLYDLANESAWQNPPSPAPDIWILPSADLPRWAAAGQLAPLPDAYLTRDHPLAWSNVLSTYRKHLARWEGKPYGLPLIGEGPLCCYRLDLVKASAHQAALRKLFGRDLDGPATWEQLVRLAEYFREHGVSGQPGPSLPPLPPSDAELDRLFYTIAAGFARRAVPSDVAPDVNQEDYVFSFHYDLKTGEPRIAAPGFVHALKLLQRLQACRPAEPSDNPEEAFRDGRAVLCLTDAPWVKTFQKTPALHDKVGVCRLPGGDRYFDFETGKAHETPDGNRVPYLGGSGWLAVVARSSGHPEAAFDLLADLAGPKTSLQIFLSAIDHGGPTRSDQLYRARWDAFDLDEKQGLHLREALQEALLHRHLKNPALCLRTPRQAAHRAVLVHGLRQALLKGADAEKTLQEVAEKWRQLDREQGLEEHKADYRRSLGLLAK
jgi:ABC-type glycerol-3-phosphate transport system substrate-binding protein